MKRADMVIGMEVAVGTGSFPKRGVILSPDALPLMHYRFSSAREKTYGIPAKVNMKTTCTVAMFRHDLETWLPEHFTLSQVKPWEAHERERAERLERDRRHQAQERSDWLAQRDRIADLAERVGLPVARDQYMVRVDGAALFDLHSSTKAAFSANTVEKLLGEIVALRLGLAAAKEPAMPPVDPESALGRATLALMTLERGEEGVGLSHPVLEAAFQRRQLERAKVVLAAAGPLLTADLVRAAFILLSNADLSEEEPEVSLVDTTDLEALRAAVGRASEWKP